MTDVLWFKRVRFPSALGFSTEGWADTRSSDTSKINQLMTENVMLLLFALSSSWRYVFISQKAYQDSETRPESSVYTRMKGIAVHGDDILDTVEYARPSEVSQE